MNSQKIFNQEILDRNYDHNARSLKIIGDCAMWSIEKWHSIADIKRIVELENELYKAKAKVKNQKVELTNLNTALKESKWINCKASLPKYGDPITMKAHGVVQNVTYTLNGAGNDFGEKLDWFEPYYFKHDDNCKIPLSNSIEWMPLPK